MAPSPGPTLDSYAVELQALEDYRNFSATTIQRFFRGWIVRLKRARQHDALLHQQQTAKSAAHEQQRLYNAARTIQDAWRSYNNKRIYRFYRDLIKFKEAGNPRQMLRSINAREAALIDPAAGLHVRFRLGGSSFPPLVFYKIYTHRPVTDIGAFGPRNYAAEDATVTVQRKAGSSNSNGDKPQQFEEYELPAKLREYIKPDGTVGYRSTKGWYRRTDNNGWRPVAERLLLDQQHQAALPAAPGSSSSGGGSSGGGTRIRPRQRRRRQRRRQLKGDSKDEDHSGSSRSGDEEGESSGCEDGSEVGASSSGSSSPVYHHSPIVRREERARKLKQRRRQWLLKMYRTGMQAAANGTNSSRVSDSNGSSGAAVIQSKVTAAAAAAAGTNSRVSDSEEQLLQLLERQLLEDGSSSSTGVSSSNISSRTNGIAAKGAAAGEVGSSYADWDIEELVSLGLDASILAWTQKLDFDSYQQHWNNTAVTLGSEAAVPVSEIALLQQLQQQQ